MPAPAKDMAVIVTGAARGMGRAMTLALASAGVRVAAADLAASADAMNEVLGTARRQGVGEGAVEIVREPAVVVLGEPIIVAKARADLTNRVADRLLLGRQ